DWFLLPRRSQLRISDTGFQGLHPEPGSPHPDASPPHRGVSVILIDALLPPRATPAGCRGPVCSSDATSGIAGGMTIAIRIRPLRLADYDAMVRLLRLCDLNPRTKGRESRTSIAAQLRTPRNRYLGAFEGARLVGTVFGTHDGRKGWINRLAVQPDHRRRHPARRLVRLCERGLREQGIQVFAARSEERRVGTECGGQARGDGW